MDTRLKNRHKRAIFLIICVILISTFVVIYQYPSIYNEARKVSEENQQGYLASETFMSAFLRTASVLYYEEEGQEDGKQILEEYYPYFQEDYEFLIPYLEYQVQDQDGNIVGGNLENDGAQKMTLDEWKSRAYMGVALEFDDKGKASVAEVTGGQKETTVITLRRLLSNPDSWEKDGAYESYDAKEQETFSAAPKNRIYYFMMSQESLEKCMQDVYLEAGTLEGLVYLVMALSVCVAMAAFLLPHFKTLRTGDEWIFHAPLELVVILGSTGLGLITNYCEGLYIASGARATGTDYLIWILFFALVYWSAACLRQIHMLGIKEYWRKRTWSSLLCRCIKSGWQTAKGWLRQQLEKLYRIADTLDFTERNNRTILKIVLINFVILVLICLFWFYGIIGFAIYSVLLFFILQRYYGELRDKYTLILNATNRIAEGNLDTEISSDLGIFTSFGTELEKIQRGFKKAVDEEVKSQKMKTELITNVSHDLKTPLTAIITYVNLLKEETDEEKRRSYVGVLEQKSLRLKALIEDLFEISKASSDNITLNLVNVDIVSLFKQVSLEMEDKLQEKGLVMRLSYPDEKIILHLDSQKTYRIFSNLLGNISKYALPNTRVYAEFGVTGGEAVITLKNVSATELSFDPDRITDRFVRGDLSRNTEGSGLGLAIVKSFVELQKGTFRIETEADLFKAQIRWPLYLGTAEEKE